MVKNEKDKLKVLLQYWIAHNQDHSVEFKEWAEKAGAMGEAEVAAKIGQAVEQMDKATALFTRSLKKLNGEGK
jgi:beta-glucosidase/6-phospho-beta-glucosidase/beta-galactosidase